MAKVSAKKLYDNAAGLQTASKFWVEVVVPNVSRFRREKSWANLMNAAWSLWHFHEWVAADTNQAPTPFAEQLKHQCPALASLRDVANASKHCQLDRVAVLYHIRLVSGLGGAGAWGPSPAATGGYNTGVLAYGDGSAQPMLQHSDGRSGSAYDIVEEAVSFWVTTYSRHTPDAWSSGN